jgi:hypothetical protein
MSEGDGSFLARWSLRKQAARQAVEPAEAPAADDAAELPSSASPAIAGPDGPPDETCAAPIDAEAPRPALPDLDTLDGSSDYRGFLDRTVPKELRVAALRKAWASDPVIAGYRPLADYDWDFNAPGYGALKPTDDPAKFITALFAHLTPKTPDTAADGEMAGSAEVQAESPGAEAPAESQAGDGGADARTESPDAPATA